MLKWKDRLSAPVINFLFSIFQVLHLSCFTCASFRFIEFICFLNILHYMYADKVHQEDTIKYAKSLKHNRFFFYFQKLLSCAKLLIAGRDICSSIFRTIVGQGKPNIY